MAICPEMIKPFAEMMLPNALSQMKRAELADLEAKLKSSQGGDDQDTAHMLIEFAKALGADESMFEMANSMGFEIDDEVKALL
jgi:hypothetical protein